MAEVDILVLGATGYSGRLASQYLSRHPSRSTFTLALAGRSLPKLEAIKKELNDADVKIFVVDTNNEANLEDLVKKVKVVANAVGPYWKYSTGVVRVCAKNGVHHVDLTGETAWVYKIIQEYDSLARQTKAIIVPSCGWDSVPSDALVHLANKTLKAHAGPEAELADSVTAIKWKGGVAGGSLATMFSGIEDVPAEVRDKAGKGWSLSPVKGVPVDEFKLVYTLPVSKSKPTYGSIFILAPHNKAIVQRTWGLLQSQNTSTSSAYGAKFKYDEFIEEKSWLSAMMASLGFVVFGALLMLGPIRSLYKRVIPQPGEGPAESTLKDGYLDCLNITTSADPKSVRVRTTFRGNGDPGLLLTAAMLGESALSLAQDTDRLPAMAQEGGILTPMTAMGDVLIERMKRSGLFKFESEVVTEELEGKKTK